jgi:hypothetical protein
MEFPAPDTAHQYSRFVHDLGLTVHEVSAFRSVARFPDRHTRPLCARKVGANEAIREGLSLGDLDSSGPGRLADRMGGGDALLLVVGPLGNPVEIPGCFEPD